MKLMLLKQPDNIRIEQVKNLFRQSPFLFLGLLSAIIVIVVYFWDTVDRQVMFLWLFAHLLLLVLRVVVVRRFQQLKPEQSAIKWGKIFAFLSMISGILWGCFPLFLLDTNDLSGVFLLTTIMTGMVAGGLVPMSVFLPTHQLFSTFSLIPLIFVTLNNGQSVLVSIGIILIIYLLSMYAFSLVVNANITESIRLRFENLELLDDFRKQKQLAEQSSADKSRFLAATSHDLRQPLHAMDLYLGALGNLLDNDGQKELLQKSQRSSMVLSELLSTLMDISRLDTGEVVINRGSVNISSLIDDLHDEYKDTALEQDIELIIHPSSFVVDTDANMLGRILRNLLTNACKHSEATNIFLDIEKLGDQVILSVRDNGVGILHQQQEQVFSEFYQLKNPERDRNKGLGLGLAIVKRLANLLHHELQLESEEGGGSCFKLYLPYVDVASNIDSDTVDQEKMDISGLFIILVDDELEIRNAMRNLLLQWGCELLVADGLPSLLQKLKAQAYPMPDVLLCDYRLRENQTGLEVVVAMRQYFDAKVSALIISGDTDKVIARKVIKQGCEILHKPVQPEVLRATIYRLINSSGDD